MLFVPFAKRTFSELAFRHICTMYELLQLLLFSETDVENKLTYAWETDRQTDRQTDRTFHSSKENEVKEKKRDKILRETGKNLKSSDN